MWLANGVSVDVQNDMGFTPLIWTACYNRMSVMDELLRCGADTNAKDKGDWTALHRAANCGHIEAVATLVAAGCDVSIRTSGGLTAAGIARIHGYQAILTLLETADFQRLV